VRVLTLNRPEVRNALSSQLNAALFEALVDSDSDEDVDVVVLTGADPAFCAGLDLKEAAREGEAFFASSNRRIRSIRSLRSRSQSSGLSTARRSPVAWRWLWAAIS
jgi:enoyl-CoA hydratase/carnithine racemase